MQDQLVQAAIFKEKTFQIVTQANGRYFTAQFICYFGRCEECRSRICRYLFNVLLHYRPSLASISKNIEYM